MWSATNDKEVEEQLINLGVDENQITKEIF